MDELLVKLKEHRRTCLVGVIPGLTCLTCQAYDTILQLQETAKTKTSSGDLEGNKDPHAQGKVQ